VLPLGLADQFNFRPDEVDVGGKEPEVGVAGLDNRFPGVESVDQALIGARGHGLGVDSHAAAAVGLRIRIHEEGPVLERAETGTEVDGGRGLADPAFLVGDGDDLAHVQHGCG